MTAEITIDFGMISTIVSGVVLVVNGWLIMLVRSFNADVEKLNTADLSVIEKINALSSRLGSDYVLRTEFKGDLREQTTQLTATINQMEQRLTTSAAAAVAAAAAAAAAAASAAASAAAATARDRTSPNR